MGTATVVTNLGKAMFADRVGAAATYTTAPKYCAMGVGATGASRTASASDTALTTEVETRTSGTVSAVTTSQTGDTYQVVGTITATNTRAVDEFGLFDASSSGHMGFSATFTTSVINLGNGDALQFTAKIQLT